MKAHSGQCRPSLSSNSPTTARLSVNALKDMLDAEIGGARGNDAGSAAGDDRQFEPGALQELEAEAVLDIEGLEFMAVVRIVQAAVGHHAVDIEGDQLDARGAGPGIHQITLAVNRSCMLSAPSRRPSASATSSALIR